MDRLDHAWAAGWRRHEAEPGLDLVAVADLSATSVAERERVRIRERSAAADPEPDSLTDFETVAEATAFLRGYRERGMREGREPPYRATAADAVWLAKAYHRGWISGAGIGEALAAAVETGEPAMFTAVIIACTPGPRFDEIPAVIERIVEREGIPLSRGGETAVRWLSGKVMEATNGKANPSMVNSVAGDRVMVAARVAAANGDAD